MPPTAQGDEHLDGDEANVAPSPYSRGEAHHPRIEGGQRTTHPNPGKGLGMGSEPGGKS